MTFSKESEFEDALIEVLKTKGWADEVLKNPTEEDLLKNWSSILYDNNRHIDRLNNYPLTSGEMQQILEQITNLRTPLKLNGFINGKTVTITRDNPNDKGHFGKEISLKIYDRREIAAGQSRYQIVQQPQFKSRSKLLGDRRGDLMLLINGMPVIHIELKRSGVDVKQACNQIEKYTHEGVFSSLFSLVQVFVAMEPKETLYFANPGVDGKFNDNFYFHWADFNNEPVHNWKDVASSLLSIPMAHQLIGFYTVADNSDGILKVMRSYQYYAANAISDKVSKTDWSASNNLGGYIWHTTGSGKTMTSFKSAQLVSNSKDADKVIFLMDRIELGVQSHLEYKGFADDNEDVQDTRNTIDLVSKIKSSDPKDTLIVTSIQKMSNINSDENGFNESDIWQMNSKRIVFIVDEAHRSTFGDMLITIKETFPHAIFFGFTGTPIQGENQKKKNTTSTVFGNELHRYSIADGIRDRNVLGFDPYKVLTYRDRDLRREVALMKAKAKTEEEAINDKEKSKIYYKFMDSSQVRMYGSFVDNGKFIPGIENYISKSQYQREEHQRLVVQDIVENWIRLSHASKFHAILATSSIPEAIEYYNLFKELNPELKITALFDPTTDNNGGAIFKEDALVKIIDDYNNLFDQNFTLPTHAKFKKDISYRLAHKNTYKYIEREPEKQIDLLIVVDQMLTGFDSKWVNTLYLDKILEYENIIQAFSRTNRLFGLKKPFGTIKYYRKPHTMEQYIEKAVELYSGDKPLGLFVQKLGHNLKKMNRIYDDIYELFDNANIENFKRLPEELSERGKFAKLFKKLNSYLEAAKIQGFKWSKLKYTLDENVIELNLTEEIYLILALRYSELVSGHSGPYTSIPFEVDGYLAEIGSGVIDIEYMNSRFNKYLKELWKSDINSDQLQLTLNELHRSFAFLSQKDQKIANIFLNDVQRGDIKPKEDKTLQDYLTEYRQKEENDQIHLLADIFRLDERRLRDLIELGVTKNTINEYGRFTDLKNSVDKSRAKEYFEKQEKKELSPAKVNRLVHKLLQDFIISGGFTI